MRLGYSPILKLLTGLFWHKLGQLSLLGLKGLVLILGLLGTVNLGVMSLGARNGATTWQVSAVSMGLGTRAYAADGMARIEITSPQDPMMNKILPGFVLHVENSKHVVTLRKVDGSAQVLMQLLKPIPYINTLEKYAEYVMVYYKGSHLTPQPQRRGYSFRYRDNLKCAGLLTFFDGSSYLLMSVCGKITQDEMTKALSVAKKQLGLDEILYRSALPNVYY